MRIYCFVYFSLVSNNYWPTLNRQFYLIKRSVTVFLFRKSAIAMISIYISSKEMKHPAITLYNVIYSKQYELE